MDQLDRRRPGQHAVLGLPDFAHAAFAQLLDHVVAAHLLGSGEVLPESVNPPCRVVGHPHADEGGQQQEGHHPEEDLTETGRQHLGNTVEPQREKREDHHRQGGPEGAPQMLSWLEGDQGCEQDHPHGYPGNFAGAKKPWRTRHRFQPRESGGGYPFLPSQQAGAEHDGHEQFEHDRDRHEPAAREHRSLAQKEDGGRSYQGHGRPDDVGPRDDHVATHQEVHAQQQQHGDDEYPSPDRRDPAQASVGILDHAGSGALQDHPRGRGRHRVSDDYRGVFGD